MLDLDALEVEAKANLYCQWDMSPKIVLSLIARVRELEADLGRLAFRKNWYESLEAALARVRELEVERNRLAADVAMLRPGTARVSALVDRVTVLTLEKAALLTERDRIREDLRQLTEWSGGQLETQHSLVKDLGQVEAERNRLRAALYLAKEHMDDLAEAWQRGALSEHDGLGGTRSNRNIELLVEAREVLGDWKSEP